MRKKIALIIILSFAFFPFIFPQAASREETIDTAINWMIEVSKNPVYGYDRSSCGQANQYSCVGLVIAGWKAAGLNVPCVGTESMYKVFLKKGFVEVTDSVDLNTGEGLEKGDIVIRVTRINGVTHVVQYIGDGKIVQAAGDTDGIPGDSQGNEIFVTNYFPNYYEHVIRFEGETTNEDNDNNQFTGGSTVDSYSSYPPVLSSDNFTCETIFLNPDGSEKEIKKLLDGIFSIIKISAPVLTIVLTLIDYLKSLGDPDALKKANKRLVRRIVIMVLVLFLPYLLELIFNLFGLYNLGSCEIK